LKLIAKSESNKFYKVVMTDNILIRAKPNNIRDNMAKSNKENAIAERVEPFKIEIPQETLDDLKNRLEKTRWTDEVEDAGWDYGTNLAYMKDLAEYWQNKYDWRKHEAKLNEFHQFKVDIGGLGIHFVYERGEGSNPTPIILTHGWPDSFYRFHKIIPMLTNPEKYGGKPEDSFDVIVPSIPGFGFSDHKAMSEGAVANLWGKLMIDVLGYGKFAAAGGDLGSGITKSLTVTYPEAVTAIHLTDVGYPTGQEDFSTMSEAEQKFAGFIQQWWFTEGAYNMIQATKPQTLGYGLNDSPVGLAAWIIEKFYTWSDCHGNIENSFTKDELITNVMIYWVTETINSSIRTYLENARAVYTSPSALKPGHSEVPAAVASFPAEAPLPREWAERNVKLKRFTKMPRGGHFAAMEEPELLAQDIREFFSSLR
jgi:pimeloyl-ACP methyl ester carboxylesterase